MATKAKPKTTFEPRNVIRPIYTGGSVSLDRDGRILVTCLGEDALLTDLATGRQLATFSGDGEIVTTLALTPDASHLIVCSRSFSMRIYALHPSIDDIYSVEPELIRTLKAHTAPVVTTAVDSTGTLLATGGADGLVKVWDIRGGYITHTFRGHSGIISSLRFFETAAAQGSEAVLPSKNKKKTKRTSKHESDDQMDVDNLATDPSTRGFRLASGAEDGKIRIWDLYKRVCSSVLDSHVSVVRALDFSHQENALMSASRDKTMILWDARSWKVRKIIPVLETVESAGFFRGGIACYTGGENGVIRLWEADTGREITKEQQPRPESEGIVDLIYQPDLPYLLSVRVDQTLDFYSLEAVRDISSESTLGPLPVLRRITGTYDEVIDLAYVHDNSLLALATNTEDIRIISLSQAATPDRATDDPSSSVLNAKYFGADVALLTGHEDIIICLDVDWSGHWLATGAKDNTAKLWKLDPDGNSFICYATFSGHAESLGAIALPSKPPPKDSAAYNKPLEHPPPFLITGSQDRTVKRWDVSKTQSKNTRALYTRKAHDKDINAIDINHNNTLFTSASQDRLVKIWSLEEGEVIGVLRGHRRGVWSVKFAPKDTPTVTGEGGSANASKGLVLTGSGDKTVKIWSLSDYSCLRTMEGHTNSVLKVVWLGLSVGESNEKRGLQVASAGGDGLVKVWDVNTGELECTLDNHEDRVWALVVHPKTNTLVSGGGDSIITFWEDTTSATVAATVAVSTARVEQEQQLQNYIRSGSYRSAITLALQLNHPARLLSLFTSVVSKRPPEAGSLSGVLAVDEVLRTLGEEQLFTLLLRLRDWNSNARTAPVAQAILWTLVKLYPASHFSNLQGRSRAGGVKGGSVKEVLDALAAYTDRHYKRMEELVDESYLLEYTLREMDEVVFGDGVTVGQREALGDGDMVMV